MFSEKYLGENYYARMIDDRCYLTALLKGRYIIVDMKNEKVPASILFEYRKFLDEIAILLNIAPYGRA